MPQDEPPPQQKHWLREVLSVRHNEPLNRRHVFVVIAALILFETFLGVMLYLFPQGG